jgi:hypothetical protein
MQKALLKGLRIILHAALEEVLAKVTQKIRRK